MRVAPGGGGRGAEGLGHLGRLVRAGGSLPPAREARVGAPEFPFRVRTWARRCLKLFLHSSAAKKM